MSSFAGDPTVGVRRRSDNRVLRVRVRSHSNRLRSYHICRTVQLAAVCSPLYFPLLRCSVQEAAFRPIKVRQASGEASALLLTRIYDEDPSSKIQGTTAMLAHVYPVFIDISAATHSLKVDVSLSTAYRSLANLC